MTVVADLRSSLSLSLSLSLSQASSTSLCMDSHRRDCDWLGNYVVPAGTCLVLSLTHFILSHSVILSFLVSAFSLPYFSPLLLTSSSCVTLSLFSFSLSRGFSLFPSCFSSFFCSGTC